MMNLVRSSRNALVAQASAAWPTECCGLLAGGDGTITRAIPIPNLAALADAGQRLYVMKPAAVRAALTEISATGLELLGLYHSHPHSQAWPSRADALYAVRLDLLQLIISLQDARITLIQAFRFHDQAGSWTAVGLRLVDDHERIPHDHCADRQAGRSIEGNGRLEGR